MAEFKSTITVRDDGTVVMENFADSSEKAMKETSRSGDQASKKLKKSLGVIKTSTGGTTKAFKRMGAAAISLKKVLIAGLAVAAAVALKRAFAGIIISANEQEDAVNRLNAALKTAGDFSESVSLNMQDFASSLQRTTIFAGDVILQQLALAKAFGFSNAQAKIAVKAATDLSVAAGINLEEALRRLGRTISGSIADVSKFAPEIANLTKEQLAAGEAAEVLARAVEGAAEAQTKTFSGALKQTTNSFGDLSAAVGGFITQSDIVKGVIGGLSKLFSLLADTIGSTTKASESLDTLWDAFDDTANDLNSSLVDMNVTLEDQEKGFKRITDAVKAGLVASDEAIKRLKRESALMISGNRNAEQTAAIKEAQAAFDKITEEERLDRIKRGLAEDKRIAAVREALKKEEERKAKERAAELVESRRIASEAEITSIEDFNLRLASLTQSSFAQRIGDLTKFNQANLKLIKANIAAEKTLNTNKNLALKTAAIGLAGALLTIAEQSGGKFFAIAKKFAIAQAIVSTLAGAAKALELPFPANLLAFATVIAKGFATVATIRGTSPGVAGGGAVAGGGVAAVVAPPVEALPTALAEEAAEVEEPRRAFNVRINITGFVGDEARLSSELGRLFREAVGTDEIEFGLAASTAGLA